MEADAHGGVARAKEQRGKARTDEVNQVASKHTYFRHPIMILLLCAFAATLAAAEEASIRVFPQRTSTEAAVVEWGHRFVVSPPSAHTVSFDILTSNCRP